MPKNKELIKRLQRNFNVNYMKDVWAKMSISQREEVLSKRYRTSATVKKKAQVDDIRKLNPSFRKYFKNVIIKETN